MGKYIMKVLAVVGMPGSGKGEFSTIAADFGIPVIVMGDVIREEVKKAGLPPVDDSMGIIAKKLRESHGMAAIAHACIPYINEKNTPVVLVDGVRGDAEVLLFKETFPDFSLISIKADPKDRFYRLSMRGRSDDLMSESDFTSRDDRETSFGLDTAIDMADICIVNEGTLEEFREKVTAILRPMMEVK